jgi:hypothetical protein
MTSWHVVLFVFFKNLVQKVGVSLICLTGTRFVYVERPLWRRITSSNVQSSFSEIHLWSSIHFLMLSLCLWFLHEFSPTCFLNWVGYVFYSCSLSLFLFNFFNLSSPILQISTAWILSFFPIVIASSPFCSFLVIFFFSILSSSIWCKYRGHFF